MLLHDTPSDQRMHNYMDDLESIFWIIVFRAYNLHPILNRTALQQHILFNDIFEDESWDAVAGRSYGGTGKKLFLLGPYPTFKDFPQLTNLIENLAELFSPRYLLGWQKHYPNWKDVLEDPGSFLAHLDTAIRSPNWPESEPVIPPEVRDSFANFRGCKRKASSVGEWEVRKAPRSTYAAPISTRS